MITLLSRKIAKVFYGTTMEKDLKLKVSQKIGSAINPRMRFAMVELDALEYMGELIKRAPNSAQLLVKLIRMMSPHSGGVIVVSRETMREIMGCSMPTVDRALKLLMEEAMRCIMVIRLVPVYSMVRMVEAHMAKITGSFMIISRKKEPSNRIIAVFTS